MDLAQRKRKIHESFEARYGVAPSCWVRAPGRVDLMGSHTDYNEGFVMTREYVYQVLPHRGEN